MVNFVDYYFLKLVVANNRYLLGLNIILTILDLHFNRQPKINCNRACK